MKSLAFSIVVSCAIPNLAFAEPTPEEACAFFLPTLIHPKVSIGSPVVGPIDFKKVKTSLERYSQYVSENIFIEMLTNKGNGNSELHGIATAKVHCTVDIVDRRVLEITVGGGTACGTTVTDERYPQGYKVKIQPVASQTIAIGNAVHKGKY